MSFSYDKPMRARSLRRRDYEYKSDGYEAFYPVIVEFDPDPPRRGRRQCQPSPVLLSGVEVYDSPSAAIRGSNDLLAYFNRHSF